VNYDPSHFLEFYSIERKHFWFYTRNKIISLITGIETRSMDTGYRVLEAGCGTGNVLEILKGSCINGKVIGLDLFNEGLNHIKQFIKVDLVQGDINTPPFYKCFDLIGLFDVLEHIDDDTELLIELFNLLRPGGKLLITVPAHMSLWSYFDEAYFHRRRYSINDLTNKLLIAGFHLEYITYYMSLTYPFVWFGRRLASIINKIKKNSSNNSYDLAKNELHIVPIINELASWLLSKEGFFIKNKIKLPFGSSLLVLVSNQQNIH